MVVEDAGSEAGEQGTREAGEQGRRERWREGGKRVESRDRAVATTSSYSVPSRAAAWGDDREERRLDEETCKQAVTIGARKQWHQQGSKRAQRRWRGAGSSRAAGRLQAGEVHPQDALRVHPQQPLQRRGAEVKRDDVR